MALVDVDVLAERDPALERAVLDLHLLVDAARASRGRAPLAGDRRASRSATVDVERCRVDAGELDDDRERRRVVGAVAVDLRPEAGRRPEKRGTCQRSAKSSSISLWSRSMSRRRIA